MYLVKIRWIKTNQQRGITTKMSFHLTLLPFFNILVDSDFSQNVKKALRIRKVRSYFSSLQHRPNHWTFSSVLKFVMWDQASHLYLLCFTFYITVCLKTNTKQFNLSCFIASKRSRWSVLCCHFCWNEGLFR